MGHNLAIFVPPSAGADGSGFGAPGVSTKPGRFPDGEPFGDVVGGSSVHIHIHVYSYVG